MPFLQHANLNYGSRRYSVEPSETSPLPLQFDFSDPEGCARKIFAIMSNASGGHPLKDCTIRYHIERGTANLTCSGAHIYYCDYSKPRLTVEEAIALRDASILRMLGSVFTDQYGEGWKRAVWR